jgi:hypothetical protein
MAAHSEALTNVRRPLTHAIYSDVMECMIGFVCVIDNVKRSIAPSPTKDRLQRLCHY